MPTTLLGANHDTEHLHVFYTLSTDVDGPLSIEDDVLVFKAGVRRKNDEKPLEVYEFRSELSRIDLSETSIGIPNGHLHQGVNGLLGLIDQVCDGVRKSRYVLYPTELVEVHVAVTELALRYASPTDWMHSLGWVCRTWTEVELPILQGLPGDKHSLYGWGRCGLFVAAVDIVEGTVPQHWYAGFSMYHTLKRFPQGSMNPFAAVHDVLADWTKDGFAFPHQIFLY